MQVQQRSSQSPKSTQAELASLSASLSKKDLPGEVTKVTKELHSSVTKLGKASRRNPSNPYGQASGLQAVSLDKLAAITLSRGVPITYVLQALEKAFIPDVSQAHRELPFDRSIIDKVPPKNFEKLQTANSTPCSCLSSTQQAVLSTALIVCPHLTSVLLIMAYHEVQ